MSELDKLIKENKKLKVLLKDAVELLSKYKEILTKASAAPQKKKKKKQNSKASSK